MSTNDINARIQRGIALLDAKLGRANWLPKIDLDRLDLGQPCFYPSTPSSCGCVCAQLAEPSGAGTQFYTEGLQSLGVLNWVDDVGAEYGFDVESGGPDGEDYDELTTAWTRAITALREEA